MMTLETTWIPLTRLRPSPTQPRKHFDEDAHVELTQSMKTRGFTLSALLVRPWPGDEGKNGAKTFEIVTGERRWRAASAAEIADAPCFVQDLSDVDVLEIQLIENIQRTDLTAIEEAEGYRKILALRGDDKKPIYTYESLALRIGKSERTIRQRVRLCELDDAAKREVEAGRFPVAVALLVARIPDMEQRRKATQMVLHPVRETGPLSYRRTEELIHREFIRDLRAASFDQDDAELYPVQLDENDNRCAGGACADCPFRSGNKIDNAETQDATFQGRSKQYTRAYICLKPPCYDVKEAKSWQRWQVSETDESKHRRATTLEQSLRLYPSGNTLSPTFNVVDLAEHPDGSDLRAGEHAPGPWKSLIKNRDVEVIVTRDRAGKTHELVDRFGAIEAARLNGFKIFKVSEGEERRRDESSFRRNPTQFFQDRKEQEKSKSADRDLERAILLDCVAQVAKKFSPKCVTDLLRLVVAREILHSNAHADFFKRHHLPVTKDVSRQLKARKAPELAAMLVEFVICDGGFSYEFEPSLAPWLEIFGISHKQTAKKISSSVKAIPKSKAKKKTR